MNPTAIENHMRIVLMDWAIIIAVAWFFGRLGKKLGQPLTVGEIVAGLLLGPSALGLIWPANWPVVFPAEAPQSLQLLGELGIILLLFQVGMEFDFGHFRNQSRTVISVSVMGMVAPMLGGLAIGHWLHDRFAPKIDFFGFQLYICIALSITALPMLGRILLEMKLERTAFGALAVSAAAIDDVIGWIGLAAVTALATSNFQWLLMVGQVIGVTLFFILLMKIGGPALRWFWRKSISNTERSEAWLGCGAVLLVGAAGKLLGCWGAGRLGDLPNRDALSLAALMNTRALMGLIAINVGYELGLLPKDLFTMFVIMSLVTTAMTGPLLKLFLPMELRPLVPEYANEVTLRATRTEVSNAL
ncbi:MAG TPA: cation:proton antiporter [Verrucomicrobiae bacterium]|jgi:Kef-type K+ transport system membrane component KefB|nr:cation:proton antiporter [Verrucomicrobiae bacterium]